MDLLEKLKILGESAKYDVCAASSSSAQKTPHTKLGKAMPSGICHSFTPDGRCVSLFKILLSNICEQDCAYCPNRVQRDLRRTRLQAEELAALFMEFYRRNYVEGLFLSSGIMGSTAYTMEELLKTVELLRQRYQFGGYIHLKILPGASAAHIEAALKLANRVSLNMEAPTAAHLMKLSHSKRFDQDIVQTMSSISRQIRRADGVTHTTQYIVGAAGESDKHILQSTTTLYEQFNLKRAYFSAFQPIPGTPLDQVRPAPLIRENRLYQSDWLLRVYGFQFNELIFNDQGNLDLSLDPKLAYARRRPEKFPVEINQATYHELLRVPGIGPRSARRIVALRRRFRFSQYDQLKTCGIVIKRALPFITLNGKYLGSPVYLDHPDSANYEQLSLWEEWV